MLNKNITRLRKSKGLTQVEFAKQLHVTQSAVSHWESGRSIPDTVQLFRIAEFFGVSVEELSHMKSTSQTPIENLTSNIDEGHAETKTAPADDPLTEQIMEKARLMNEEELRQLLRIMDAVKK